MAPLVIGVAGRAFDKEMETVRIAKCVNSVEAGELRVVDRLKPGLPTRRVLPVVPKAQWNSPELTRVAVPLPEADCQSSEAFSQQRLGWLIKPDGTIVYYQPETVLVKFRDQKHVSALRVEPSHEQEATKVLSARSDVQFAELNTLQQRQFQPNDARLQEQWHHSIIGSSEAWEYGLGRSSIRIAIVDTPFQMSHPDLAGNVVEGWSVVSQTVITNSAGIDHSTLAAGLAAAVINNDIGVAGVGNCQVLPIEINGFIGEMYEAILWAADHDVRVVNLSWSGADSPTLNEAGLYLKEHSRGLVAMAGVNGFGYLDYPNYPHIYCISMTDQADNPRSRYGEHIDFAAPGYQVFSTGINSGYTTDSGTSYSTPLFSGAVAMLFSINPNLSPDEAFELLRSTAVDKSEPGWDQYFGWGRIDVGRAATAAHASLPRIISVERSGGGSVIRASYHQGLVHSLFTAPGIKQPWSLVTNAAFTISNGVIEFTDSTAAGAAAFYRVSTRIPE